MSCMQNLIILTIFHNREEHTLKRDKELEKILAESIKDVTINLHESKNYEEQIEKSALLSASSKMYREVKDDFYKIFTVNSLSAIIENASFQEVLSYMAGEALFFAYDQTGDERYKNFICELAEKLLKKTRNSDGVFAGNDEAKETDLSDAYEKLPFYMNYETKFGGKEHYSDVVKQYQAVRAAKRCEKCGLYNNNSDLEVALYMASMIDTMEVTDQPVYEIFAGVKEIFKETFAALKEQGKLGTAEELKEDQLTAKLVLLYALLKGCRMKAILSEKYEEELNRMTEQAFSMLKAQGKAVFKNHHMLLAATMMAYAESIKERSYQVYGRNKGGAIWS